MDLSTAGGQLDYFDESTPLVFEPRPFNQGPVTISLGYSGVVGSRPTQLPVEGFLVTVPLDDGATIRHQGGGDVTLSDTDCPTPTGGRIIYGSVFTNP